ncbi:MAG: leucine-rich repeat protein, partial [Clostridia bacterium]|nr:leucine-rich repeat protein [Clostridia bacterium]
YSFYDSGLYGEIIIPNSVKIIGECAFANCHIDKIIIENKEGNVDLQDYAFSHWTDITYTK